MPIDKNKELELEDTELSAVLAEVVAEVNAVVKSEAAPLETLAKAHQGEEISSEPQSDTTETKTAPESSGPEAAKPADEGKGEGPSAAPPTEAAPVEEAPAAPVEAAPEGEVPEEAGPIDIEQLTSAYCEMDVEDLQAHYAAAKLALAQKMAAAQPPAPAAPPMAEPAAAPAPAAPAAAPAIAEKSEKDLKIEALEKSVKEANDTAEKIFEQLTKVFSAPLRKSITSLDQVVLTKDTSYKNMSKAEVSAALDKVIRTRPLNKADQKLIINWELGQVKLDEIQHLLTATK